MSEKLWQGRFSAKTARIVEAFTSSIQVDRRLYAYDIQGSIAHCKMLAKTSIIGDDEASQLIRGLEKIKNEIETGLFQFNDSLEDIHMHIESRLVEITGPVAQKLHTARSRNDQIALDVRMYLRDETCRIIHLLYGLQKVIVMLAGKHLDTILPGYTHMQRAQPVLLSHHLMAYFEMFSRDLGRLENCLQRINVMPLGCAALAGTTYPIDREFTAELLGFDAISANSIDAVSDRDFIIEFLSAAAICMVHFSRLSEELILWSTFEFNFIELPDSFATGSSIMPQKKNPDMPELIRGKTGRVYGHLMGLLTTFKGLPLTYNKDMQEDKEALFDGADTVANCLEVMGRLLGEIDFDKERLEKAVSRGHLAATDLADYLVRKGVTFREAHEIVGKMVLSVINKGKELKDLTLKEMKGFTRQIGKDVYAWLDPLQSPGRRNSPGGTGPERVRIEIESAKKELGI